MTKLQHMKPKRKHGRPTWPAHQLDYLKAHAGVTPAKEIAWDLGRSHTATQHMANKHGISLRMPYRKYSRKSSKISS